MDTNILEFKPRKVSEEGKPELVYECNGCGSQNFKLKIPMIIECSGCNAEHSDMLWSQLFKSKTPEAL